MKIQFQQKHISIENKSVGLSGLDKWGRYTNKDDFANFKPMINKIERIKQL